MKYLVTDLYGTVIIFQVNDKEVFIDIVDPMEGVDEIMATIHTEEDSFIKRLVKSAIANPQDPYAEIACPVVRDHMRHHYGQWMIEVCDSLEKAYDLIKEWNKESFCKVFVATENKAMNVYVEDIFDWDASRWNGVKRIYIRSRWYDAYLWAQKRFSAWRWAVKCRITEAWDKLTGKES